MYATIPLVMLAESLVHHANQSSTPGRGEWIVIAVLIGIGIVGGVINALVLWVKSAAPELRRRGWAFRLILPLAGVMLLGVAAASPNGT